MRAIYLFSGRKLHFLCEVLMIINKVIIHDVVLFGILLVGVYISWF